MPNPDAALGGQQASWRKCPAAKTKGTDEYGSKQNARQGTARLTRGKPPAELSNSFECRGPEDRTHEPKELSLSHIYNIYIYIVILFSCNWQWLALSELSCQLILNLFPQRQHHRQTQQKRTADLFWTSWAKQVACLAVDLEGRMSIHMKVQGMFNCKLSSPPSYWTVHGQL